MYSNYFESFISALENRKKSGAINYLIELNDIEEKPCCHRVSDNLIIPDNILFFYEKILYLNVFNPRSIELLRTSMFELIDNRFLWFSTINKTQKICFDTLSLNEANEWDIININNRFLITKTISSYLTNKLWAWVDRERNIWEEEKH